jgi:hypothetical protein
VAVAVVPGRVGEEGVAKPGVAVAVVPGKVVGETAFQAVTALGATKPQLVLEVENTGGREVSIVPVVGEAAAKGTGERAFAKEKKPARKKVKIKVRAQPLRGMEKRSSDIMVVTGGGIGVVDNQVGSPILGTKNKKRRKRKRDQGNETSIKTKSDQSEEDRGSCEESEHTTENRERNGEEEGALEQIECKVWEVLEEIAEDMRHKRGLSIGMVQCKGYSVDTKDFQRRNCTCLSLFNEKEDTKRQERLDVLVTSVGKWVRSGTFKINGFLEPRAMGERLQHFQESLFCRYSRNKLICIVDLTNLYAKKKWHVHLQSVDDHFLCLPTFLRLLLGLDESMQAIPEKLVEVGEYNINKTAVEQLKAQALHRFNRQYNASLVLAYAKMALRKERDDYDNLKTKAKAANKRENAYDYLAIDKIAEMYMGGKNPEKFPMDSVIDTYMEGGRLEMTDEEKKEREQERRKTLMRLNNRGIHSDHDAIAILIPGTAAANNFLEMFNNGKGRRAGAARACLFQLEEEPLNWVMEGMFMKAVTTLKDKQNRWESARNTGGGKLRYLATSGGLFNGFKSFNDQVINKDWEVRVLQVDRYLHDLLGDAISGDGCNKNGMEHSDVREKRWSQAKSWVDREIEKNGNDDYRWWSQERMDWRLWMDFGLLYTEKHGYQDPHYDYQRMKEMQENWVSFMALTDSGMMLQVWPDRPQMPEQFDTRTREGKIKLKKCLSTYDKHEGRLVLIPKGVGLAVGGDVCHAGSMLCEPCKEFESFAQPRLHCYIREKRYDMEGKKERKAASSTRSTNYTSSVGIGESKGNRWKDYDSECDSDDYNDEDQDKALRRDNVLCKELRANNHRGVEDYVGRDGKARKKLNDTMFG